MSRVQVYILRCGNSTDLNLYSRGNLRIMASISSSCASYPHGIIPVDFII